MTLGQAICIPFGLVHGTLMTPTGYALLVAMAFRYISIATGQLTATTHKKHNNTLQTNGKNNNELEAN